MRNGRIQSIEGMRTLLYIMVFLYHSCVGFTTVFTDLRFGPHAVECFFIISGLCIANSTKKSEKLNIIQSIGGGYKRLLKLYPLYVVTFFMMAVLTALSKKNQWSALGTILYLLVLQSFVPNSTVYYGFNSVSWFLSSLLFCYIVSPYVKQYLERKREKTWWRIVSTATIMIVGKLLLEIICISVNIGDELYEYVFYICPVTRCVDFVSGMMLGYALKRYLTQESSKQFSYTKESLIQVVFLIMYILTIVSFQTHHWINTSTLVAVPLVFFIALDNGVVSGFLENRLFLIGSKIAMPFYLLHTPVIRYCNIALLRLHIGDNLRSILLPFIAFAATTAACMLWNYGVKHCEMKRV